MARKRGKRFRLLLYERMWQRWAFPCLLIVPASVAMWLLADRAPFLYRPFRALALIPALAALVILVYTFLARRLAWVQCRAGHLRIQTPVLPLAISYTRIKAVRPSRMSQVFDPAKETSGRRNWLRPYWGMTVLVVELSSYPVNKRFLRLWFSPSLFAPNVAGFVLLVDDWMALSRQITDYRADWEARRTARRKQVLEA